MVVRFLISLFFCFSFFYPHFYLHAATLHAIVVCDTTDPTIGKSTQVDGRRIKNLIDTVTFYTNMKLKKTVLMSRNTTPKNVIKHVNALNIQPDDVVLFSFSGHGDHQLTEVDTRWPALQFNLSERKIKLKTIIDKIINKQPRLAIILADSCNNYSFDTSFYRAVIARGNVFHANRDALRKDAYRKLFLEKQGLIVGIGATEGTYAYGNDEHGGFFTFSFWQALQQKETLGKSIEWENIFQDVFEKLFDEYTQVPDYLIDLH